MVLTEVGDEKAQESLTRSMLIDTHNPPRLDCDYSCVPWEIWFEILSRLHIKTLFVCKVVCKIWRGIISRVTKNMAPLPLCGLVLRKGLGPDVHLHAGYIHTTYICLTTKATLDPRELSIASGYDQGLITGLKFDFGALGAVNNPLIPERKPTSLTSHKGLLLVDYSDGTHEVHNPVTKKKFTVPKSELSNGALDSRRGSCGFIINLSDRPGKCSFVIVRFSRKFRKIEMYYSVTKRWSRFSRILLGLHNDVVKRATWALYNYVSIYKTRTLSLYFLTDAYHGVVLNFRNLSAPKAKSFAFPLPNSPLLLWNDSKRRRIWESEKNLLLSYCDSTGLKIWKAGSTRLDTWTWVPQIEISNLDPLRNVVGSGREDIVKLLNAGGRLKPIAFHPYVPIIYLLIKENIFGYDLVNDTLVDIAKINDVDLFEKANGILGYPFIPCITPFHDRNLNNKSGK